MAFKQKIIFRLNPLILTVLIFLIKIYKTSRLYFFDAFESLARATYIFGRDREFEFTRKIETNSRTEHYF
jgi:hypothetical protein